MEQNKLNLLLSRAKVLLRDQNKQITKLSNNENTETYKFSLGSNDIFEDKDQIASSVNLKIREFTREEALLGLGVTKQIRDNDPLILNHEICAVCMQCYGIDEEKCVLDCGHEFHNGCLGDWLYLKFGLNEDLNCPLCRGDVEK